MVKEDWEEVKIGEVVELEQGQCINAKSKHLLAKEGLPLLRITDLINNRQEQFINPDLVKEKVIARPSDLIFTRTGQVGLIFKGKSGVVHNNCFKIKPNEKVVNKDFIYYFFKQESIYKLINSFAKGAAQADLSHGAFKSLNFRYPKSLETQKKIATILSNYDNLIENNEKRIKILEQMAKLIYEEWFVKFKFPEYENVKMIDSKTDFGNIPEGWGVKSIMDIDYFTFINKNIKEFSGEKEYFATANIDGLAIVEKGEMVNYQNKPSRAQKEPKINSVWFARMKDSYKVLGVTKINKSIAENSILSSGFAGFESEEKIFPFLFLNINSKRFDDLKNLYATGATQVSLNNDGLSNIKIIYPKKEIVEDFGNLVIPLINKLFILQLKNQNLRKTRDLLLPKLISGEIDVSNLDIKIPEIEV